MELNPIRRRYRIVRTALYIIMTVVFLSSCRSAEPQDPDRSAALSLLEPCEVGMSNGEGALYDLTPLFGEDAGPVCAYGLKSEYSLLFLQRENAGSRFVLRLLDLRDGSITTCGSFPEADVPRTDDGSEQDLELLCADPVVVCDRARGVLYRPSSEVKTVILPEWLRGSEPCCMDGNVWLSSDRGIIYTVTADGSIEPAWTLPCGYGALTPVVSGHEGSLTFATYSLKAPSDRILVDADPRTGESRFYLSDLGSSRFSVYADGLLLGTSFRTAPKVSVCSLSSHVKKEMQLPDQITALLRGSSDAAPPIQTDSSDADPPGQNGSADAGTPGNSGFVSFSTVPLSICGGWCTFMFRDEQGCASRIYLWDTVNCAAADWEGPSETAYEAPEPADYGELSRAAEELGDRYGVTIVLGDNIPSEFRDYTAEPATEPSVLSGSLSVLSNTLSLYPEGYFDRLKGDYFRGIVLYLTGALTPLNAASSISNASAFTTESNGLMQVAFDLYDDLDPSTVIHELTHAADYRFLGEGLLDEDVWNAMNPEGFSYYYSYIDASGESYETAGSTEYTAESGCPARDVYFIDPYSKTYPMEDRAVLMENLLSGNSPYAYCFSGGHVQEKLSCYFRFLRDTLDDGTWPASTAWEEALREAAPQE